MADWAGHARSNYFKVKDQDAFADLCEKWNLTFVVDKNSPERVGFLCENEFGGLPNYRMEEEEIHGKIVEFEYDFDDFLDQLTKHLEDNEVAIMYEVGAEKMRYITGIAYAINNKRDVVSVSLDDIYKKAKTLGKNITDATY